MREKIVLTGEGRGRGVRTKIAHTAENGTRVDNYPGNQLRKKRNTGGLLSI